MAKETLLNWTAFEKALGSVVEGDEPTNDQRDLLEFYHLVKANIGTTVGTVEFEDNPTVYVSLADLNEDVGIVDSGITHSDAVHEQLKKSGVLESKTISDDEWFQPSKEPVFNLGKLETAIKELGEDHPTTQCYNALFLALTSNEISIHTADFNGNSRIVRMADLHDAGVDIPLGFFIRYVEKHEIPISEETGEAEEINKRLTDEVERLTTELMLLGRRYQRLKDKEQDIEKPSEPEKVTVAGYINYLAQLFVYRAEREGHITPGYITLAEQERNRIRETGEIPRALLDNKTEGVPINSIEKTRYVSENRILRRVLQPFHISDEVVHATGSLYAALIGQMVFMDMVPIEQITTFLDLGKKTVEDVLAQAEIPKETTSARGMPEYDVDAVREKLLLPAFVEALHIFGIDCQYRTVKESQSRLPVSAEVKQQRFGQRTIEEIEQQRTGTDAPYTPLIDAIKQMILNPNYSREVA
ncbi:MAG: hypothetical protein Q7R76_00270 [Candidatus Woesearchaeota archaeon]|nr:hypothetical protein [Candidatus Woesearchaeota archaeon]